MLGTAHRNNLPIKSEHTHVLDDEEKLTGSSRIPHFDMLNFILVTILIRTLVTPPASWPITRSEYQPFFGNNRKFVACILSCCGAFLQGQARFNTSFSLLCNAHHSGCRTRSSLKSSACLCHNVHAIAYKDINPKLVLRVSLFVNNCAY